MISSNLLHIMDLTCRFGGLLAVDNVTTLVSRGEIRALIGPNGAGKSTTLNLITGIYQPDAGSVFLDGKTITGMSPAQIARAGVARTFQTIRLWKQMSLLENVMVGHQCRMQSNFLDILFASKRSRAEEEIVRSKAYDALELVNLSSKAMQLAGSLSYGQQRRLEIARALATEPSVLLLDEPAAGMNNQEANELVEQIFTIREKGVTVVLIEHNMPLVMRVADKVTVLSFGRKIAEGTPIEIRENRDVIAAYLGNADDDAAA